ncbi:MAG TPA: hypothetical protein VK837_12225, partial [Longimicrobiales bacterium]|nr:hypothetical protein [Longimicrobiales bacterium]
VCPPAEPECARAVVSAVDARARAVLAASGGAPLPGAASTLGRRTASSRHASVALRLSAVGSDAFAPAADGGEAAGKGTLVALSADGALAIFDGFFAAPTVGGVLSIDALASAGWLGGGGSIDVGESFTWGAGARVGILRESFTLPGLSVSAMYRGVASLTAGDMGAPPVWNAEATALSLRATLGKRIGQLDAVAGAGWDDASGAIGVVYRSTLGGIEASGVRDLDEARWSAFAGVGWTFLVFQVAGEAGWIEGGAAQASEVADRDGTDSAWFGSLSFRFTY